MSETTPSLYQQTGSKGALRTGIGPAGPGGSLPRGNLVGGRVTGKGTLELGSGHRVGLPESVDLPRGSVVMGRLEGSGEGVELHILSSKSTLTELGPGDLRPVLRRLGVSTTEPALASARRHLRKWGYIRPGRIQESGGGEPSIRHQVRRLLQHLDLEVRPDRIDHALNVLRTHPGADLASLWAELTGSTSRSGAPDSGRAVSLLRDIQARLTPVSPRDLDSNDLAEIKAWLRRLGVRADPASLERARVLVDLEVPPTKRLMGLIESWSTELQNERGSIDRGRVRALLFLHRYDLPVQPSLVRDLGAALSATPGETVADLPRLDVSTGDLAGQMKQFVRGGGFDLERQITENPQRAARSLRALLAGKVGSSPPADPVFPEGTMLAGMNRFLRSLRSGDHTSGDRATGQFLKHALASVERQGRIYLFVPFEEGGDPKLIQLRYEDERDPDAKSDADRWSVTLNLELSKLGALQVEASRRGERLDLRFRAEEPVAVRRIRAKQTRLREALGTLGFETTTLQASRIDRVEEDMVLDDAPDLPGTEPFRLDLRV